MDIKDISEIDFKSKKVLVKELVVAKEDENAKQD